LTTGGHSTEKMISGSKSRIFLETLKRELYNGGELREPVADLLEPRERSGCLKGQCMPHPHLRQSLCSQVAPVSQKVCHPTTIPRSEHYRLSDQNTDLAAVNVCEPPGRHFEGDWLPEPLDSIEVRRKVSYPDCT
jgi:hypothetical protein